MDDDLWFLLETRLEELTSESGISRLNFYWLGGELFTQPTDYYYRRIESMARRMPEVTFEHHFQSNLLHFNPDWGEFLHIHGSGKISSSMDHPNLYRYSAELDRNAYVERWIEKKQMAEEAGIAVSVISLPNERTLEMNPEDFYLFYKDRLQVPKFQLNLPFHGGNVRHSIQLDMKKLISFMGDLYKIWIEDQRSLYLAPFTYLESYIIEGKKNYSCVFAHTCGERIITIGPDGAVVPCDYWITSPQQICYGNIREKSLQEILESETRRDFMDRPAHLALNTSCGSCEYWKICHGGCPVRAFSFYGNLHSKDYYCPLYKALFGAVNRVGKNKKDVFPEKNKFTDILFDGIV